ncbi:hypothetical protein SCLCIDRAFT_28825 [Scleroderma citrinum Foug A]|uniref:HSF-type DNA-binding domain-containing protein n=1 Tax=Scleroderma citrinum Foug A TaxID=1036808 RepID=A0A0C2ZYF5_9AGAM|nr:hypothetical protein SCLCIDRAFT_28825 [Scleroderma citrinum Foug A]
MSDFVKKLYKILKDHSFSRVVSWGSDRDCSVVKVTEMPTSPFPVIDFLDLTNALPRFVRT